VASVSGGSSYRSRSPRSYGVGVALFALMSPGTSLVPDLIVVGLIVAGGLYFAKMLIFNRAVLDTEPGIPDAF
jgi:hypothetical protein